MTRAMRRLIATGLLALAAFAVRAQLPLAFDSELIRLSVSGDTLTVDGLYRFVAEPGAPRVSLFYPYPTDSLLGAASTEFLHWRPDSAESWRPAEFRESQRPYGARWILPVAGAAAFEVRTVYRQRLKTRYARYIVTTTAAWGRPLTRARFELRLPPGAALTRASFPFARTEDGRWDFEAEAFLPDEDIVVEWELAGTAPASDDGKP